MTRTTLLSSLILCASVLAVQAQTEIADSNEDGVYSLDEMMAAYPDLTEDLFLQMDLNADGVIDLDELATARGAGVIDS